MGLANSVVRIMMQQHGKCSWVSPVVTLGVQDIPATYQDLSAMFRQEKQHFIEVPTTERKLTTSYYYAQSETTRNYVHPQVFFQMLGIHQYDDLDFADFEKPTLIHDMNQPIPSDWAGKYGLVVDGGTIEHVFDLRTVFVNIVNLLKVGGDVFHVSPLSGWLNHGFYQLNPCLFYDFYSSNGFDPLGSWLIHIPLPPSRESEKVTEYRYSTDMLQVDNPHGRMLFAFRARKREVVPLKIPIQGFYQTYAAANSTRVAG